MKNHHKKFHLFEKTFRDDIMSTRGNYVFCGYPYKDNGNGDWVKDPEQIVELKKGISDDTDLIKRANKIYVHWDNYPSYALPTLFEFLHLEGAQGRFNDHEYLSAWFVAYKTVGLGKTFEENSSFTGVGLENHLNDWCDYTYVILPDTNGTFRIFIFNYNLEFIEEIHSTDYLEDYVEEDWWY